MTNASGSPGTAAVTADKLLLRALHGERTPRPPVWLMRQAGRYLPEYRELRQEAGSFLDLCYTPDFAVEVTLQPIRRFGFDAAILFSDILVVPHALGRALWFEEGKGPCLEPLEDPRGLPDRDEDALHAHLAPVYETLGRLTGALPPEVALIGFAGAPWTLATYMIEGGSSRDFLATKAMAYGDPDGFQALIGRLEWAVSRYLIRQIEAGAEAVQIFDSWAGALAPGEIERWSLAPLQRIVAAVKAAHPAVPVIVFPRGAGPTYAAYAAGTEANALGLDTGLDPKWARTHLQGRVAVQGNLDPALLVAGGPALDHGIDRIIDVLADGPFVFNLGHGVVPQTPPENVARLVERVRGHDRPVGAGRRAGEG